MSGWSLELLLEELEAAPKQLLPLGPAISNPLRRPAHVDIDELLADLTEVEPQQPRHAPTARAPIANAVRPPADDLDDLTAAQPDDHVSTANAAAGTSC